MKKTEQYVITINRELGSGGRTVGEKLAERLGVPFYDKAVIKALTAEYHLTTQEIEKLKGNKGNWWSDFQRKIVPYYDTAKAQYYKVNTQDEPELITTDDVFNTEAHVLREIGYGESCVIAGRSAFFVLKAHPNHISILIQAPMKKRVERVMEKQGITREQAEADIHKVDKWRENYVKKYAGTSRYDTRNYDLVINMAELDEDDAVEIILDYINKSK